MAYDALVVFDEYDELTTYEAVVAYDALTEFGEFNAQDAVPCKDPVNPDAETCPVILVGPTNVNEPDNVISYASTPVNASIDWVTWWASTTCPVNIFTLLNIFAIFYYKYYKSKLIIMLVSVTDDRGNGCANLATAINSLLLLYKPTVVTYGLKYEPVAKLYKIPSFELPDTSVGFCEKLNSFCRILHLY